MAELTPGSTAKGRPAPARASASSPPRPKTNGSPPFRRTTPFPHMLAAVWCDDQTFEVQPATGNVAERGDRGHTAGAKEVQEFPLRGDRGRRRRIAGSGEKREQFSILASNLVGECSLAGCG